MIDWAEVRPATQSTLVVGGYGYRNIGDEAILAGLIRLLGRDGLVVVSRSPAETARVHQVRAVSRGGAMAAGLTAPAIVIGGGGLFGRHMGRLGRALPAAGLAAALAGRSVSLLGIGVDRDLAPATAGLLRRLGRRARRVVVRDRESVAVLRDLGVFAELAPDLSSLIPSAGPRAAVAVLEALGFQPGRRPIVAACLTAVEPALATRAAWAVSGLVEARPDLDVCLVPMSRHPDVPAHDDGVLARRVQELRPRARILDLPEDPAAAIGAFEAFDAVIAMRYHSLLFADRAGVPIVPIAYAEKCRHWLAEHRLAPVEPTAAAIDAAIRNLGRRSAA